MQISKKHIGLGFILAIGIVVSISVISPTTEETDKTASEPAQVILSPAEKEQQIAPVKSQQQPTIVTRPNFAEIKDTHTKKQAFFNYLRPFIVAENDKMLALRELIKNGKRQEELTALCSSYRVAPCTTQQLLYHIDIIPESMSLAQAAMESAWGTSRFATDANNYFGEWCFVRGCGLVPSSRQDGAIHEVASFKSAQESVASYFRNINRHSAYEPVRRLRFEQRQQDETPSGYVMVGGLTRYSGIGHHYIDELRAVIRVNDLENTTKVRVATDH